MMGSTNFICFSISGTGIVAPVLTENPVMSRLADGLDGNRLRSGFQCSFFGCKNMTTTQVRAVCPHDCPDTCAMLVTVQDGVATEVQGDPAMPFPEGTLCTKVAYYLERTYAPDRLKYPMRRVGRKGSGQFKRISWDEALDE